LADNKIHPASPRVRSAAADPAPNLAILAVRKRTGANENFDNRAIKTAHTEFVR
jgi:hypothetical protein